MVVRVSMARMRETGSLCLKRSGSGVLRRGGLGFDGVLSNALRFCEQEFAVVYLVSTVGRDA